MPDREYNFLEKLIDWYMGPALPPRQGAEVLPEERVASEATKKLMRYHGTNLLIDEPTGNKAYFFRNGKKIRVNLPKEDIGQYIP